MTPAALGASAWFADVSAATGAGPLASKFLAADDRCDATALIGDTISQAFWFLAGLAVAQQGLKKFEELAAEKVTEYFGLATDLALAEAESQCGDS